MDSTKIRNTAYTLPSIITGGVAYYLFNSYFKDQQQNTRRCYKVFKRGLPLRLQAYERVCI
jgi:hypothetical protein